MNPTDAYRKQIRKREIKRVSYRIQFFFFFSNWRMILSCGGYMISIGFIISLFVHSMLMEDLTLVLRWINLHIKGCLYPKLYIFLLLLMKFVMLFDSN